MENREKINKKIEKDYNAHQENPGPSEESIKEKDDKPVANTIKWVIAIAVIIMAIIYFFFL
ncbi:hypothetical protein [Olivibacter sitiensis]|uniref:hypothetical protein n=1 Tax=Olivibacter sitiensis TaxID=376470 RepID=UPI00041027F3|nr:hypothetical protein [Olivibacter sitiensis]